MGLLTAAKLLALRGRYDSLAQVNEALPRYFSYVGCGLPSRFVNAGLLYLLEKGARPNLRLMLTLALDRDRASLACLLLPYITTINEQDPNDGEHILHAIAKVANIELAIEALRVRGINTSPQDHLGRTPFTIANARQSTSTRHAALVQLFKEHGIAE